VEIILLQDIKGLGKEGDTVKAKDGYARNYLIPKKLAALCTKGAIKAVAAKRKKKEKEEKSEEEKAKNLAKKLSQLSLTIPVESGVNDTLFGGVTSEVIARALEQEGVHTDKKNIMLENPIKKLGIYNIEIKLHPGIKETLKVWVVKK